MKSIPAPDIHRLRAAEGWIELGNAAEAAAEWEQLSPETRHAPGALEIRWQILARQCAWAAAVEVAGELLALAPDSAVPWLHKAYAQRRSPTGGLKQAWDTLHAAADLFPDEAIVAYNLACYATQLDRLDDGWEWYLRTLRLTKDTTELRRMALGDADLAPLHDRIRDHRPG